MKPIYLLPLDSIEYKGMSFTVGERVAFFSEEEIDTYLNTTKEVEKEYTIMPGIFGGLVQKITKLVRVRI